MNAPIKTPASAAAEEIAREMLSIDTLETRNSDSEDFHDIAVWTLKAALIAAFNMGVAHANTR